MKTGIIIITFNLDHRIFILQVESLQKFCKDEFTIEVFDNSTDEEKAEAVRYHAERLGIIYKRTIPGTRDASQSHAFSANYSYLKLKESYDYFFYLDHDVIAVKDFSVVEILGDKVVGGMVHGWHGTKYFWPGCLMWNNNTINKDLIDFTPNHDMRTDTGGGTYKIIEEYGLENCIEFDEIGCENPLFNTQPYNFYMMIYKQTFMHFLCASNWRNVSDNDKRLNTLMSIAIEKQNVVLSNP